MKACGLIPAHNEEKTIQKVISYVKKIKLLPIVIDDGSTDNTAYLAKKSKAIVLRHDVNKGKGEAIKTGFDYILTKQPKIQYTVLIDADFQYNPIEATRLLKPLKNGKADFVSGYRNFRKIPFRHRLGNWVWKTFFNLLFGTNFKDTNCGYMALTKEAMKKIKRIHGGYIIENTMFIEALRNNLRIKQVPVSVMYKEKSKITRGIRMVLGVLVFIIKEGIKYRLGVE
jgi:glycosyltransferase involved in cell wall biosynthesis